MRRAPWAIAACLILTACTAGQPELEQVAFTSVASAPGPLGVLAEAIGVPATSDGPLGVLAGAVAATPTAAITPSRALFEGPLPPPPQLPRGGRQIFPTYTVVAHYGTAGTPVLGVLGEGTPDQAGAALLKAVKPFGPASGRRILPAFELIASIAQRAAGADGLYSTYIPDAEIARYLAAARKIKAVVILDLQPGRADLLDQAKHFEKFLKEPDVGLAIDPEWKLYGDQLPGKQIGYVDAASVNRVSAWLAALRQKHRLPEKLFVLHQFKTLMLPEREKIVARTGLATVLHIDGFGSQSVKRDVYDLLAYRSGPIRNGLKLFIDEDTDMFTPAEAMSVRPQPDLITYQ